jgi:hypothetical protein
MKKILSEQPLIHPTAEVRDCSLGRYTDIGARTILLETEVGDYSYIVNDSNIAYTKFGKFCSVAAMTRINPGNHPMQRASRRISLIAPVAIFRKKATRLSSSNGGAHIASSSATMSGSATAPSCCRAGRSATAP